jgi:hypothetical protein
MEALGRGDGGKGKTGLMMTRQTILTHLFFFLVLGFLCLVIYGWYKIN